MQSYLVIIGVLAALVGSGNAFTCYTCTACGTASTTPMTCATGVDTCISTEVNALGTSMYTQSCYVDSSLSSVTTGCTQTGTDSAFSKICYCNTDNCNDGNGGNGGNDGNITIPVNEFTCYTCIACGTASTTPMTCATGVDTCISTEVNALGTSLYTQSCYVDSSLSPVTTGCTQTGPDNAFSKICYCNTDNCNDPNDGNRAGQMKVSMMLATLLAAIVGKTFL